jgi:hypothetical protein
LFWLKLQSDQDGKSHSEDTVAASRVAATFRCRSCGLALQLLPRLQQLGLSRRQRNHAAAETPAEQENRLLSKITIEFDLDYLFNPANDL